MARGTLDRRLLWDAYVYLLGRALVIRQERTDLAEDGIDYNVSKRNPVGQAIVGWVNPNLDVANLEAWIAVDEDTPAVLEVPPVADRYYTVQICDEWGEVITNINERNYPLQPNGRFVFVAPGSDPASAPDAVRIELRSQKAKLLARVEIQGDPSEAERLQHAFTLASLGRPAVPPAPSLPAFDNARLLGVELFDQADEILRSAPDVSPVAVQLQAQVRAVARTASEATQRPAIDALLREEVIPSFQRYAVTEAGISRNHWVGTTTIGNYGEAFAIRTAANYVGIWANARHEVIYFVTTRDADGAPLDGSSRYVLHFPPSDTPNDVVNAYWSLSMVDVPGFLAVPNRLDRHTFNSVSPPPADADGSLRIVLAPASGPQVPEAHWLPAPDGKPFSLTFRTYVPKDVVKRGEWFPPAIERID